MKLAVCLIVKGTADEAPHLARCLENIAPHVDGIFLNVNHSPGRLISKKIIAVTNNYDCSIITTEWTDNFAEARNANLAQVPQEYEWVLWLDTDDTVEHPEKVRKLVEKASQDSIYADYVYEQDESGNPVTVHMVARLFKNNGGHVWKGRIHETLIETRGVAQGATKDFYVIHHADGQRRFQSFERNIRLLKQQLEDEGDNPDPRTLYYLGCTYIDAQDYDSAKSLLTTYLTLSGWNQERAAAHTKLGRLYLEENDHHTAKQHFMQAIGEDPTDPEPQVEMGSLELELKQYGKARTWLEGVLKLEKGLSTLEHNPMSYTFRTYLLLADTYLGLGGSYLDKALEYAKKALKYKKKDKHLKQYVKTISSVLEDKKLTEQFVAILKALKQNKEQNKIKSLLSSVPKQLEDNPLIVQLRNEESFTWPQKSVVIMTGDTAIDAWGPWSLEEGIGGSEEAVIRLSKHLKDLGYRVVVYAKPAEKAGLYDGVMWRNYWEANLDDKFDIFVAWRSPYIFDREINARKSYLWLHDVMEGGEFTPERLNNLTKVIVLSEYHRSLFPMIPDDKILMSGNGIDPEQFEALDGKVQRDQYKVFYGSSHVRGLAYLYEIWPSVKKAIPQATLDVYYGRESYDSINAGNPERLKWMDDIQALGRSLDGVTEHGKVSQDEIVKASFRSGVWAYPTTFPEISCITAMKCQAAGAIPVVADFAALQETVQFGIKQDFDPSDEQSVEKYKDNLISALHDTAFQESERDKMMEWSRKTYGWRAVAEQWVEEFGA